MMGKMSPPTDVFSCYTSNCSVTVYVPVRVMAGVQWAGTDAHTGALEQEKLVVLGRNVLKTPMIRQKKFNLVMRKEGKCTRTRTSGPPITTHHPKYPLSTNRPARNPITITKNNYVLPIQLTWLALMEVLASTVVLEYTKGVAWPNEETRTS